jgi:hypothetical protein
VFLAGILEGISARVSSSTVILVCFFRRSTLRLVGSRVLDGWCLDLPSLSVRDALALLGVAFLVRSLGP